MSLQFKKPLGPAILACCIGIAGFWAVVGHQALIPSNVAWLDAGDPIAHYLGWAFFRESPWTFPLGLNPLYGLELSNAIVFSDSLPLLALPLKLFATVLPHPFQYFGIWLLACFVLQAWFGWKLAGLVSANSAIRVLVAALFVFSPPLLWRLHGHLSLVGHFCILAALYLYFIPANNKKFVPWLVLIALTALIHAYLLAMVLLLWLSDTLTAVLRKAQSPRRTVLEVGATLALLLLVSWQAGYFTVGKSAAGSGYGYFRMNLLSVINPRGWSYLLKDIPEAPGDYEGGNYLGLGMFFALLFAVPSLVTRKVDLVAILRRRFVFVLTLCALTLFAISNKIGVGTANIVIPLPEVLLYFANIFRASGRMFWPVYYMIVFTVVTIIIRSYRQNIVVAILGAALAIQVCDTSAGWLPIRKVLSVAQASTWKTPLCDPFWGTAAKYYNNVHMIMPENFPKDWELVAPYAVKHHLGTDAVNLARVDSNSLIVAKEKARRMLDSGHYDSDSFYIIDVHSLYPALKYKSREDLIARINGFTVLAPGWKQCMHCPQDIPELTMTDALGPLVTCGERLVFTTGGNGLPYLYGDWGTVLENIGMLSADTQAGLVMSVASDTIGSVDIELNALLFEKQPQQVVRFFINDVPVHTVTLTKPFGNRVTIQIPEQVKARINETRRLDLMMQFPDAIDFLASGFDNPVKLAVGLVAITLH